MNIGKILKDAREEQSMSLDEVANKTKIRKKFLIAIENNDFDEINGEVYVKAFIRGYSNAIGINAEPLIKAYEDTLNRNKEEEEKNKDKNTNYNYKQLTKGKRNKFRLLIYIILILAIILFIINYFELSIFEKITFKDIINLYKNNEFINT